MNFFFAYPFTSIGLLSLGNFVIVILFFCNVSISISTSSQFFGPMIACLYYPFVTMVTFISFFSPCDNLLLVLTTIFLLVLLIFVTTFCYLLVITTAFFISHHSISMNTFCHLLVIMTITLSITL